MSNDQSFTLIPVHVRVSHSGPTPGLLSWAHPAWCPNYHHGPHPSWRAAQFRVHPALCPIRPPHVQHPPYLIKLVISTQPACCPAPPRFAVGIVPLCMPTCICPPARHVRDGLWHVRYVWLEEARVPGQHSRNLPPRPPFRHCCSRYDDWLQLDSPAGNIPNRTGCRTNCPKCPKQLTGKLSWHASRLSGCQVVCQGTVTTLCGQSG